MKPNKEQSTAIKSVNPKILCLAGAGTGKTRTLIFRMERILNEGIKPENILCMTFTRLAGLEMRERLGEKGKDIFINTFHSFCHQVIQENLSLFGLNDGFTILSEVESADLLNEVCEKMNLKPKKELLKALLDGNEFKRKTKDLKDMELIANEYSYQLKMRNSTTINNLLLDVSKAFRENPELGEKYHDRYHYVFVDEYQDTDDKQMDVIKGINPQNLFLVGDDYQAIYGFRGTKVEYILNLSKDEDYETIELKQNYRSSKPIVKAAQNLIAYNKVRTEKQLVTTKEGEPVEYHEFLYQEDEFQFVVDKVTKSKRPLSDFTVIARTNKIIGEIAKYLNNADIPTRILGEKIQILENPEMNLLFQLMDTIQHPSDRRFEPLVKRFYPEDKAVDILIEAMDKDNSIKETIMDQGDDFGDFIMDCQMNEPWNLDVDMAIHMIMGSTFILERFKSNDLMTLIKFMKSWKKVYPELKSTLNSFMSWNATKTDMDMEYMQKQLYGNVVNLTTAHSSKGLEFPVVFLVGMNNGEFPLIRKERASSLKMKALKRRKSLMPEFFDEKEGCDSDIEEERRLCFVAVTRAEDKLYITRPVKMVKPWTEYEESMEPSPFIKEMNLI